MAVFFMFVNLLIQFQSFAMLVSLVSVKPIYGLLFSETYGLLKI